MIPYGKQDINQADIETVINVLKSDFLTQGPQVPLFEKTVSHYCGAAFGVAVNSATSALHIACLALGLEKDDWLWTSPNSFVASANCGLYCGARIDFVDIDPLTYNLSIQKLEAKLIQAKVENKLPKVLIPVHFAGQSCDMKRIHALSKQYGFSIIEDASHAIGGKYLDKSIGGCQYSDITVFSFHPVKIITTAEGGLATTNSKYIADKMQSFRSHGITRDQGVMSKRADGAWYYQQVDLGFNYRMTDLQAALGLSQMNRLDGFIKKRHALQERYDQLLRELPVTTPHQSNFSHSALHLYPIQLNIEIIGKDREEIFNALRNHDIGVNVHYIPIHTQPFYLEMGFNQGDFPVAESYYSKAISLPLFSQLSFDDQDVVVSSLKKIIG
jgi:UDP-4-amino-4,6-dideoxy-N-acetyl-beta-L-altrosamine transaminase